MDDDEDRVEGEEPQQAPVEAADEPVDEAPTQDEPGADGPVDGDLSDDRPAAAEPADDRPAATDDLPQDDVDEDDTAAADEADEAATLRESHAWRVSADAVRSLPHDDSAAIPPPEPSAPTSSDPSGPPLDRDGLHEPAATAPSPHAPARPTGWSALGSALHPRATRAQVLAGVLCAVLGFAIVVQLRQNGDSTLSQLRQDDLVRLLDEASTRSDQLSREAADLQRERDQLVNGSNTRQAAIDAARRSAATQGILAGRLPAVGPGVRITISDNGGSVRPITMLNMLEELRNAGAEAVQLNDQRVTASSAFTGSAGAVVLDGTTLTGPYTWLVIGDPDTIATALDIPGGAMAYVRNDGGTGSVDKLTEVHVDALHPAVDPRYATPAAVPGS